LTPPLSRETDSTFIVFYFINILKKGLLNRIIFVKKKRKPGMRVQA
jgi:hypothetical protein